MSDGYLPRDTEQGQEREQRQEQEGEKGGGGKAVMHTCSGLRPVKQNMPIWLVMCDQSFFEPHLARPSRSLVRIAPIRSAISFTSVIHSACPVKRREGNH